MIPVAIQTTGNGPQAEALIPVEVKTAAGKAVKRAAVVPVTVKQEPRNSSLRARAHRPEPAPQRREAQDTLTRGMVRVMETEESAVNAAGQMTLNFLEVLPRLVRSALRVPTRLARQLSFKMEDLYAEASTAVDRLAA